MAGPIEPFSGEESLAAPPARVFAALTDLDVLAQTLPGLVSSERVDDRTLRAVVRPGFSFLRANLRLTVTIIETTPPAAAALRIAAQSIGLSMQVESRVRIEAIRGPDGAEASKVHWEARVGELSGLVTAVGPTLIRAAADKVIRDGWDAVRKRVEA